MYKEDFENLISNNFEAGVEYLLDYANKTQDPRLIKVVDTINVLKRVQKELQEVHIKDTYTLEDCIIAYVGRLYYSYIDTLPNAPTNETQRELDVLFGIADASNELDNLTKVANPENKPITNTKSIFSDIGKALISTHNSNNALPTDPEPISTTYTDGVHVADDTCNLHPISSHNSSKFVGE